MWDSRKQHLTIQHDTAFQLVKESPISEATVDEDECIHLRADELDKIRNGLLAT